MPIYTYRDVRTGRPVERNVPIALRDALAGFERIFEPGVACPRLGQRRPTLQAQQVLRGYEELERKGELRMGRREAARVRRVWGAALE